MKIKALQDFWAPSKGYVSGKEYDVTESIGMVYVERGFAEEVTPPKPEPKESKHDKKK